MGGASAFTVGCCSDRDRFADILAVVHAASAGLQPPSSVLAETVDDMEARLRAGPIIVARSADGFVGSLFCTHTGDALYLTRLATLPAWRRCGIGAALIAAAEREARKLGTKRLTLRVRTSLPDNLHYFQRAGFAVTGEGQDRGRPPYFTMQRDLSG